MTIKWSEKDVLEHIRNLRSPFEIQQEGTRINLSSGIQGLINRLKGNPQPPMQPPVQPMM